MSQDYRYNLATYLSHIVI